MRKFNPVAVALLGGLLSAAGSARAAETDAPEWVRKLPANTWTKLDQGQSGNRVGAGVHWLAREQKLVLIGGMHRDSRRESPKPGKMIYDAPTAVWSEYKDEPALPVKAQLKVHDSTKRLSFTVTLPEGSESLAGERVASNTPLDGLSAIAQLPVLSGALTLFDPVNKELHLIGGASGGAPSGSLGNWVYALDQNVWRKGSTDKPALQALRASVDQARAAQQEAVAQARNLYYSGRSEADLLKESQARLAAPQAKCAQTCTQLAAQLEKEGPAAGVDAQSLAAAVRSLRTAAEKAGSAARAFESGKVEAAGIADAEAAQWRCDEALDWLASEPTPRTGAMGQYDPERKAFVVFGGDHGDYLLGDTWLYECGARSWKRLHPAQSPSARFGGQMFWHPGAKTILLLSGNAYLDRMKYQSFSRKLDAEVWQFDPAAVAWTMLVKPGPEVLEKSPDQTPWFVVNNAMVLTSHGVLICPAVGGNTYQDYMTSSTWMLKLDASAAAPELTARHGVAGGVRHYRSQSVEAYDPGWYDGAPRGEPAPVDAFLAALPANRWVEVPQAPRPCPERSWGTALYDPLRDQMYFWTGGHCADPADIVHHYHPGINRWSIPYVAGGIVLGNQFTGRPDCQNHTYKNYAWDAVSGKMVALHRAGTHVYDPDRRDWTGYTPHQPFVYNLYSTKCVSTPLGVMAWVGGCTEAPAQKMYLGLFDAKALKWTDLPVKGAALPANVHGDEGGMTWDSKRKVLYLHAASSYQKPNGKIYRYDPATQELRVVEPKHRDVIGDRFYTYRETVYLPEQDLVLFGMGFLEGRQIAYDPAGERWVLTNITKTSSKAVWDQAKQQWTFEASKPNDKVGSITFSPVLDTRRNVLWAPSDYKSLFVMRVEGKSLELSAPAAAQGK
ncbi:MAG: hypothetical protein AMXMBFR7_23300 [Planctomycetota bacterium]